MMRCWLLFFFALFVMSPWTIAQTPARWKQHAISRPRPRVVVPGGPKLPVAPPSDAILLFDGTDLSHWRSADAQPPRWTVTAGVMESVPGSGYLFTAQAFGDIQLHVEWAAPAQVEGNSQGRGNSGVFLMGLYEVQVLDSYQNDTYPDGQAAAIYGQYPPLVNASLPPGHWQSYDITFRRPRFNPDGSLAVPGRTTVLHNGVLVQDNVEPWGPTAWLRALPYKSHPDKLPLSLQDHGNPVRYRNIWLRELRETPRPGPPADNTPVYTLSAEQLDGYVGTYRNEDDPDAPEGHVVVHAGDQLQVKIGERFFELVPRSKTEFAMRWTSGKLVFELDAQDHPIALSFHLAGSDYGKQKKVE